MRQEFLANALSRREFLARAGVGGALLLCPELSSLSASGLPTDARTRSKAGESVVLRWNEAALQGVRDSKLGPPMVARALAIIHTCAYDAWAAYDHHALGTRFGDAL